MKARVASPYVLVDLNGLDDLRGIELGADGTLTIGAMATYTEHPRLGGGPCQADPRRGLLRRSPTSRYEIAARSAATSARTTRTNHLPPLMLRGGCADDDRRRGTASARSLPDDFFLGVYLTAVGPGELLTAITIPAGQADGFAAVTLGADGTCIANAAASINGSRARRARLRRRGAGRRRSRRRRTRTPCAKRCAAPASIRPSDVHASSEYRAHLAEVLAVRAARQAAERS